MRNTREDKTTGIKYSQLEEHPPLTNVAGLLHDVVTRKVAHLGHPRLVRHSDGWILEFFAPGFSKKRLEYIFEYWHLNQSPFLMTWRVEQEVLYEWGPSPLTPGIRLTGAGDILCAQNLCEIATDWDKKALKHYLDIIALCTSTCVTPVDAEVFDLENAGGITRVQLFLTILASQELDCEMCPMRDCITHCPLYNRQKTREDPQIYLQEPWDRFGILISRYYWTEHHRFENTRPPLDPESDVFKRVWVVAAVSDAHQRRVIYKSIKLVLASKGSVTFYPGPRPVEGICELYEFLRDETYGAGLAHEAAVGFLRKLELAFLEAEAAILADRLQSLPTRRERIAQVKIFQAGKYREMTADIYVDFSKNKGGEIVCSGHPELAVVLEHTITRVGESATAMQGFTEFIARIRFIAWVGYQIAAGQPYNVTPNHDQMESLIQGVKVALAHPEMTQEENHENWCEMKRRQGWVYGPVKDFEKKTHPDLVPFDRLPLVEQQKDLMDLIAQREGEKLVRDVRAAALREVIKKWNEMVVPALSCEQFEEGVMTWVFSDPDEQEAAAAWFEWLKAEVQR